MSHYLFWSAGMLALGGLLWAFGWRALRVLRAILLVLHGIAAKLGVPIRDGTEHPVTGEPRRAGHHVPPYTLPARKPIPPMGSDRPEH